jgi:signal peptidase II
MAVLCLALAVAFLDQLTKTLVRDALVPGAGRAVIPGLFDLRYVQNTGAAWGTFQGLNHWLVALSAVMLVVLAVCRRRLVDDGPLGGVTLGLLLGGVAGNLIDRLRLDYVVDFLDFHWGPHHFPAFNVADTAICCGVGLYLLGQRRRAGQGAGPGAEPGPGT